MTEELKQKFNDAYGKSQEELRAIRWRMSKEKVRFVDEIRIIPRWVKVLAVVLLLAPQAAAVAIHLTDPKAPPLPVLILLFLLGGSLLAAMVMLYGYINRDAKRRGMNATLWTLLVIFVPYLIGVIVYFIVREPRPFDCPQCSAIVSARFNYCPNCKYNLRPTCPQCKREIHVGDKFCPYCAGELEEVAR